MISIVCRWAAWLLLAAIVFVTLSPIGFRPEIEAPANLERFAAFAALGGTFCLGYPKHRVPVILFMVAVAGMLEALQHLVPGRHGRIADAAVKELGVAAGVLVAGLLVTWFFPTRGATAIARRDRTHRLMGAPPVGTGRGDDRPSTTN